MKVGFVSLGCPKNLVDSEVMMGLLQQAGHEITPQAADADVLVVNTCSFIAPAQRESVETILEMAGHKKSGKAQRLVVTGCMVERFRAEIQNEMPEVDALLGTHEIEQIVQACSPPSAATAPALTSSPFPILQPRPSSPSLPDSQSPIPNPYLYDHATPRLRATPPHLAYLKIAEGCDHGCSFCVIPQYRGDFRSRRFESVVVEAQRLFAEGVRELVLIGQDTTCYGDDLGLKEGLATLLARLAEAARESGERRWIRTLYFYPNRVTQHLLETVAAHPELCNYVDMPLQHASASVLKRMRRGSNGDKFLKLIERMRRTIPGVALRSSFIVGFPGETEADFEELFQFVEAAQLDWVGVFAYSDEAINQAVQLDGKVPQKVIEARRRRLMSLQRRISRQLRRAVVGQRFPVLVEGPSEETDLLWQGRLEGQAPGIDGKVLIQDSADPSLLQPGRFATIEVTAAHPYDLIGTLQHGVQQGCNKGQPEVSGFLRARS